MGKFDNIKKVKDSAAMTEQTTNENPTKKKLIEMDVAHEDLIKKLIKDRKHIGTITTYIKLAVRDQLIKDGVL